MNTSTDKYLQLALRAVAEMAQQQGLVFEQVIVLRNSSNAILHLYPTTVVARVATATAIIRQGTAWLAREIAICRYLKSVGAPVINPSTALEPGPHQHLGLILSFWDLVEEVDKVVEPYAAGRALRICHEALKECREEMPILGGIREAEQILKKLIDEATISPQDADLLHQVSQRWQGKVEHLPMQPIHGDAHLLNILHTKGGLLWADWEDTFIGPVGWDLACLVAVSRIFGTDTAQAEAALKGYGLSVDQDYLDLCIELRTFYVLVWSIIINQRYPQAERNERIQARFDWFRHHLKLTL